jgi:TRAP-type C4-dicarboxylate transport system permease small subunit
VNRFIYNLARQLTWFGAAVLALLSALSVVSIIGRALTQWGLGPVPGDFELVEVGTAIAVFSFLPWAHLKGSHAYVDIVWGRFPAAMKRVLHVLFDAAMLFIWTVLIWRLGHGMADYKGNGEETFILHLPIWWAYAVCVLLGVMGLVVYAWRLLESLGLASPPEGFVLAGGGH